MHAVYRDDGKIAVHEHLGFIDSLEDVIEEPLRSSVTHVEQGTGHFLTTEDVVIPAAAELPVIVLMVGIPVHNLLQTFKVMIQVERPVWSVVSLFYRNGWPVVRGLFPRVKSPGFVRLVLFRISVPVRIHPMVAESFGI